MIEIWKQSTLAQNYEVSNLGNIRHKNRKIILNPRDNGRGYKTIGILENKKAKNYYIHRLVAIEFLENNNNMPQINHKNGIKSDNRVENLEWCTSSYNLKHAVDNGLKNPSEKQRMVAIITGKSKSNPIKCLELNRIFLSPIRAAEKLNIGSSGIYKALDKNSVSSNYHWVRLKKNNYWKRLQSKYYSRINNG